MGYFPEVLLISFIGGLVSIDTASGWQVMISQPVVSCPIIGLIFGYPELGILMGILLELPWLINIPMGGVHGSEGNLGAIVATTLSIYLKSHEVNTENIIVIVSIMYSLVISRVGIYMVEYVRKANLMLLHSADKAVNQINLKRITWLNTIGVFYSFLMGFLLIGVSFTLGIFVLKPLAAFVHQEFNFAFGMAKYGLLGLGIGAVATLFINKKTKWYTVVPFVTGVLIFVLVSIFC
ncbi:MAG: PTS sugar transporter subunit IIC [bacterium]|nr:MAG: PTS sugar transporter subunit IIC [bacterium]